MRDQDQACFFRAEPFDELKVKAQKEADRTRGTIIDKSGQVRKGKDFISSEEIDIK